MSAARSAHRHVFLGAAHAQSERNVWAVIALTGAMMVAEIVGGAMFGSIALVADGFHMSTHAGALLLAALAYTLARRRADDPSLHFRHGQVRRSRGLFQRDHAGDDRGADRLRIDRSPVCAAADRVRRGDPDRRSSASSSMSSAPGC